MYQSYLSYCIKFTWAFLAHLIQKTRTKKGDPKTHEVPQGETHRGSCTIQKTVSNYKGMDRPLGLTILVPTPQLKYQLKIPSHA